MIIDRQTFDFNTKVLIEKVTFQPPFRYESIFEDEGCFLYISGSKTIFNSPNQQVHVNPREAVLLKCGTYFVDLLKSYKDAVCEVYAIHLYPEILQSIYRNELPAYLLKKDASPFIQKIFPDNTLAKFIESLNFYFENPTLVNNDLLGLKIKELVLLLLQTKNTESVIQLVSGLFTPRKVSIKEVIQNHMFSNLTIDKLASLVNMSTSSFKREFKKIYGDSPTHYINSHRLLRAKELLQISDKSISDIAYELGFSGPAYFSRLFKKQFNTPPSSFR